MRVIASDPCGRYFFPCDAPAMVRAGDRSGRKWLVEQGRRFDSDAVPGLVLSVARERRKTNGCPASRAGAWFWKSFAASSGAGDKIASSGERWSTAWDAPRVHRA